MTKTHRLKTALLGPAGDAPAGNGADPPAEADLQLMATLGIQFENGSYCFACVPYDNLHDAANFARMAGAGRDKHQR